MTSATLEGTIELARICSISRRMPAHATRLAAAASELDEVNLEQLKSEMMQSGLCERMARRACQAAPSSPIGAQRIIDALRLILGSQSTIEVLRAVGYDRQIGNCIKRFTTPKKNRFKAADELREHLRETFGDGPWLHEPSSTDFNLSPSLI